MLLKATERAMAHEGEPWALACHLIGEREGAWRDKRGDGASGLTVDNRTGKCAVALDWPLSACTDYGANARSSAPSLGRFVR